MFLEDNIRSNSCPSCISLSDLNHLFIDIISENAIFSCWVDGFFSFFSYFFEDFFIMKWKVFACKASEESRCNIASNQGCFDSNRSRSTTWINQRRRIFPSCKHNKSSSKSFFYRGFSLFFSIPSLMKRFSTRIEENMCNIFDNEDENMNLVESVVFKKHSFFIVMKEGVYHCFFPDFLDTRCMCEYRTNTRCIDDDGMIFWEIFFPIDFFYESKKRIKTVRSSVS